MKKQLYLLIAAVALLLTACGNTSTRASRAIR